MIDRSLAELEQRDRNIANDIRALARWDMINEERERLCAKLRREYYDGEYAASEIERLAALVRSNAEPESYGDQLRRVMKRQAMQSDAEPVAWQWQEKAMPEFGWAFCRNEEERFYLAQHPSKYNLRPLYTAPPRPAQSDVEPDRITELEREIAEIEAYPKSDRGTWCPYDKRFHQYRLDCGAQVKCNCFDLGKLRAELYTAKPRPDASAGLIEAAEWLEQRAPACYAATTAREWATELRKEAAIRARAADRSGK